MKEPKDVWTLLNVAGRSFIIEIRQIMNVFVVIKLFFWISLDSCR